MMPVNQAMTEVGRFWEGLTKPGQMTADPGTARWRLPGKEVAVRNLSLGIGLKSIQNPLSGHLS